MFFLLILLYFIWFSFYRLFFNCPSLFDLILFSILFSDDEEKEENERLHAIEANDPFSILFYFMMLFYVILLCYFIMFCLFFFFFFQRTTRRRRRMNDYAQLKPNICDASSRLLLFIFYSFKKSFKHETTKSSCFRFLFDWLTFFIHAFLPSFIHYFLFH